MRRAKKVIEVEGIAARDVPKAVPRVIKDQAVLLPFYEEGDKVYYTSSYGLSKTPYQREKEPYRVLSRSLQYDWLNEMNYAYSYRLRKWDADVERQGWGAWDTVTAWENQLASWIEDVSETHAQEALARLGKAIEYARTEGILRPTRGDENNG